MRTVLRMVEGLSGRGGAVVRTVVAGAVLVCLLAACAITGAAPRTAAAAGPAEAPVDPCTPGWTTAWHAAAQPAAGGGALTGTTLRLIVHPQVTGSQVRVRVSNVYGATPLRIGAASAAWSDGAAGLVTGTMRPVAFAGRPGVEVAAGAEALSDPVSVVAEAGRPLAVSLFLAAVPETLTQHGLALQTSYVSGPGDAALDGDGAAFPTAVDSWSVLTGVDVLAPRPVSAVVTVGDSITDGLGGGQDAGERWTDALARRLTDRGGADVMSVLNAGLSRNELLADLADAGGAPPLARFARDVTGSGASDVVLHIGTNDIAAGRSAGEIVAGMVRFAERARAAGTRVFLTTITPSTLGAHGDPAAAVARAEVNSWVLTHGREHADGVFDFAAAVADPADPARLAPEFDSGDGLHLSAAGYRALAAAVDPAVLTGSPCLTDDSPARVLVAGP